MSGESSQSSVSSDKSDTSGSVDGTESFTTGSEISRQTPNLPTLDEIRPKGRQLKADDESWAVCPIPYLEHICLQSISNDITKLGLDQMRNKLNEEQWGKLMNLLSLELPVKFLLPRLDDNAYWKRRCQSIWPLCDGFEHGENWRRMYVEKTVNDAIENFQPHVTNVSDFDSVINMCKDYVVSLDIKQWNAEKELLKSYEEEEGEEEVEDEEEEEEEVIMQMPTPYAPVNHLDVGKILQRFPNLQEVSLCSCPRTCGLEFEVEEYILSHIDIKMLADSLKEICTLKIFRLYSTWMSPTYIRTLVQILVNHPALNHLDLSFDMMTEECGTYLASLVMGSSSLRTLVLRNNALGNKVLGNNGVAAIGVTLLENTVLESLDLSLNGIFDKTGVFLVKCLQLNSTLKHLILCGNRLGHETGVALSKLIETSTSLVTIDVSSNSFGVEAGIKIKEAMEKNLTLKKLDIRLCDLGDETEIVIRELELRNLGLSLI